MAGLFSSATLEQVRAASDIVDVIGSYLPLKRAGANFVALCPFHKEKTPSFNVNPQKQIFHCFGCHKGGDVFTFVKEYESLDFPEAVKRLADRARIPLEYEKGPAEEQARGLKDKLLQIHEQIALRWQGALANEASGQIARDYLAKRGVSAEAVKLFRLGYAPDLWDDTVNWAKSKGYDQALVEKAGLILRKEGGDHYYDRFRGRLMFPICDEQGRVIGFSGRVLSGDEKTAKYVNSPETPIFKKGKVLFALDKAKRSILDAGCVVVCEGQLDTISCHMRGVTHVVAPQGTALTGEHVRVLQRYTDDIILCFDGDNAGRKAAAKGFDELMKLGVPFRVAEIPSPEDPDSFLKKFGLKAFFELLVGARGFFDWYLDYLAQLHDPASDRGRIAIVDAMSQVLNGRNMVLVDIYTQKTAMRLGTSTEAVRAELKKASRAKTGPVEVSEEPTEAGIEERESRPISAPESWLLKLMLANDDLVPWVAERLDCKWIQHRTVRRIVEARISYHQGEGWAGVPGFLDSFEDEEARSLITAAVADRRKIADPAKTLKGDPGLSDKRGILEQLRDEFVEGQISALRQRLSSPQASEAEQAGLWRQMQELRSLKGQPLGSEAEPPSA